MSDDIINLEEERRRKADAQQHSGRSTWLQDCILNKAGKPLAILANALTGLRAVMPDTFSYDEMLNAPLLMQPLGNVDDFRPRPLTDIDVAIVQEHLQNLGLERIGKDTMHQAIDVRAHERRF